MAKLPTLAKIPPLTLTVSRNSGRNLQAHSVQYLFPFPVSVAAIMKSVVGQRHQRLAMMDNVDSVISKSIRTESVTG